MSYQPGFEIHGRAGRSSGALAWRYWQHPHLGVRQYVMWDTASVALLKKLWSCGHSAGQIADRLGHSRDAVCAKLLRMGLKRGHKPPTAKPKIVSVPKRKPALLAACAGPVHKVVSARKPAGKPPKEFTRSQLNAMLAEAIANTARLPRR